LRVSFHKQWNDGYILGIGGVFGAAARGARGFGRAGMNGLARIGRNMVRGARAR